MAKKFAKDLEFENPGHGPIVSAPNGTLYRIGVTNLGLPVGVVPTTGVRSPVTVPITGVAVTAAGVHAALVTLGLITA